MALFSLVAATLAVLIVHLDLLEIRPALATFAGALALAVLALLLAFAAFVVIWREGLQGLGMAVGAASGALGGKLSDVGVNDGFVKELGAKLEPGKAALIALGSTDARDKLIARVTPYGGELIQTSLSAEDEEQLRAALGRDAATA